MTQLLYMLVAIVTFNVVLTASLIMAGQKRPQRLDDVMWYSMGALVAGMAWPLSIVVAGCYGISRLALALMNKGTTK